MHINEWHDLTELAELYECDLKHLFKIIIEKDIPVSVMPNSWYAHLWTYNINNIELEDYDANGTIPFNSELFKQNSDLSKPARPEDPLPLSKKNIKALNKHAVINEDIFWANEAVHSDGSIYAYYKLCDSNDYAKNFQAQITINDTLVREIDLERLKEAVLAKPITKPISDSQKNKLLRMIGSLALLISTKSTKYKHNDKPNFTNISSDLTLMLKEIKNESDLDTLGLGDTNLRNAMKEGVDLLYGKTF